MTRKRKKKTAESTSNDIAIENTGSGKNRRNRKRTSNSTEPTDQVTSVKNSCPLLCMDSETTNHGELLELSIFNASGEECYHQYFRPHAKKWPSDIHHITPEMVADMKRFAAHRGDITRLLNSSKYLLGCALSNDLHSLRRHGVNLSNTHTVIDIQSWFWLLNDETDRRERTQTGLAAIGEAYGLSFGNEQAHSATADTRLTLECFRALVNDFNRRFPDNKTDEVCDINDEKYLKRLVARYNEQNKRAMQIFRMRNAGGYVNVIKRDQGYSLKFNRIIPDQNENIVLSVPVEDRELAERDLRNFLLPHELKGLTGIYDMDESDFSFVRSYSNEIDEEAYLNRTAIRKSAEQNPHVRAARRALASRNGNSKTTSTKNIRGRGRSRRNKSIE